MKKKLLFIVGPTAVGKTDTAIHLAKKLGGEIISADSMQIYRYMDIGTAKPTIEEREGIPHHLMDFVDPAESFTVADFQTHAKAAIDDITSRGKLPIIAGGTGLYVNSLLYQMDFTTTISNWDLRNQLEEEVKLHGNQYLHNKLKEMDPNAADRIHPNNVKRVIRAIEVNSEGGEKMGDFSTDIKLNPEYDSFMIGLTRDREELYDRVNLRVDLMIKQGLLEEVKKLMEMGYPEDLMAFKGLGYKEIIGYLMGRYDLEETKEILKRDTRRYAKRQLTWFRRYDNVEWFNLSHFSSKDKLFQQIVEAVEGYLKSI